MSFALESLPLYPSWPAVAMRLVLAIVAGVVIGLDRGQRGHAVGLRTTILVTLAAAVAMIEGNVLLATNGKVYDSFATMDIMRMPLGILTGIGFIGAGAIVKRGDIVIGVTTAATIWVMTVIGLCFGGGQLGLGCAGTLLTFVTLRGVRWVEPRLVCDQHAMLTIRGEPNLSLIKNLADLIEPLGYEARFRRQTGEGSGRAKLSFEIWWQRPPVLGAPLDLIRVINEHFPGASLDIAVDARHRP